VDPDVFVTIAFSGYAVLVVLGIGAVLGATSSKQDAGAVTCDERSSKPKRKWNVVVNDDGRAEMGSLTDGHRTSDPRR
jgi:hypothetical protein